MNSLVGILLNRAIFSYYPTLLTLGLSLIMKFYSFYLKSFRMINIIINGQSQNTNYIGWTPVSCSISYSAPQTAPGNIVLSNQSTPAGGNVQFSNNFGGPSSPTLSVTIPSDGTAVNFYTVGTKASVDDQDVTIQAIDSTGATVAQATLMVRIRKNANILTAAERDRFLTAMAKLNLTTGIPSYKDFLDMHNEAADSEIHTSSNIPRCSFLPWHRAYVLDLERQLQKIDPSVTLPYWKFDEAAPNLFTADFMGADTGTGLLSFSPTNPLITWTIGGSTGVIRQPLFPVQTSAANNSHGSISNDQHTLGVSSNFLKFRVMENNPHGYAHVSFDPSGPITSPPTAPQDPLFFMLHCNVDRIWALWQAVNNRYDKTNTSTYPNQGAWASGDSQNIGDFANDTMWPWNGNTTGTRPPTAPGGQFPQNSFAASPTVVPAVWEMIDYQGYNGGLPIFADYDTIKFVLPTPAVAPASPEMNLVMENIDSENTKKNQLASQLMAANTAPAIARALDNIPSIDPDNQDLVKKAYSLVIDKKENSSLRLKALEKLTNYVFTSDVAVTDLINILGDEKEPALIRRGAMNALYTVSFSSPALAKNLASYKTVLRKLLASKDPELLNHAAAKLASYKDEQLQNILLEGLKDQSKAILPEEKAIQLLGLDIRAEHFPTIRKILSETHNEKIMKEAVIALSPDPQSVSAIENIFKNKKLSKDLRLTCLSALHGSLDPAALRAFLQSVILDGTEDNDIRTAALNALSLRSDFKEIIKDQKFSSALEQLKNSDHIGLKKLSTQALKTK
ncbi:MAG: hypothetical protein C5B59_15915 [Bacteroidetes bacterium]|nr:MAG: hypothetical protein C5B59_15915 [Bacteroidota bacterium]